MPFPSNLFCPSEEPPASMGPPARRGLYPPRPAARGAQNVIQDNVFQNADVAGQAKHSLLVGKPLNLHETFMSTWGSPEADRRPNRRIL